MGSRAAKAKTTPARGRTATPAGGASGVAVPTPRPTQQVITVSVELTRDEAEALRDAAFTCTSPDPRRYQAGRRALLALREAATRYCGPRPPSTF